MSKIKILIIGIIFLCIAVVIETKTIIKQKNEITSLKETISYNERKFYAEREMLLDVVDGFVSREESLIEREKMMREKEDTFFVEKLKEINSNTNVDKIIDKLIEVRYNIRNENNQNQSPLDK